MLYARTQGDFRVGEALEVGPQRRPGEVIRLKGDELVGQVYEDTTGLKPGDAINGTGAACRCGSDPGYSAACSRAPASRLTAARQSRRASACASTAFRSIRCSASYRLPEVEEVIKHVDEQLDTMEREETIRIRWAHKSAMGG
ncbi:MAG: hypothetical protein P8Z80_06070 [Pseudolabrys sp.]